MTPLHISQSRSEVGKRVLAVRLQRGFSQRFVSQRAGIDPSYLSRIETGKVQPTVPTVARIATALRVSVGNLVGPPRPGRKERSCPVSPSGYCLLDLVDSGSPAKAGEATGSYSRQQIRLLQRFARLVQLSSPSVLSALDGLLREMIKNQER